MDDNNWDLFAVVRGCCAAATAAVTDSFSGFRTPHPPLALKEAPLDGAKGELFRFPDPMAPSTNFRHGRVEDCKPLYMEVDQQPASGLLPQPMRHRQQKLQPLLTPKSNYSSAACTATSLFSNIGGVPRHFQEETRLQPHRPNSSNPRSSKRRKNQLKKVVCQMPADSTSADLWAWRKYGQKPIKGSPYPRGYYRCSSSKGCQARKQVERSRGDPATLIITYTAEHNHPVPTHRNSLAGSTRQKFPTPSSASFQPHAPFPSASRRTNQLRSSAYPSSNPLSSPSTPARLSPASPLAESTENDNLLHQTQLPLKTNKREVAEENDEGEGGENVEEAPHNDDEEEEELPSVGDMEMMGPEEMVFLGIEVLRGPAAETGTAKLPATISVTSDFFKDEGAIEDHFFRSSWLPNGNAAAAASGR